MEERLIKKKWKESQYLGYINLTNAPFETTTLWKRLWGHWKFQAPFEGERRGYLSYELDEESEKKRKEKARKERKEKAMQNEGDLDEDD